MANVEKNRLISWYNIHMSQDVVLTINPVVLKQECSILQMNSNTWPNVSYNEIMEQRKMGLLFCPVSSKLLKC